MTQHGELLEFAADWMSVALRNAHSDALLTSPYLSFEICKQIASAARLSSAHWILVTNLDPSVVAQGYLSVQGLKLLLAAGVELRHVRRLHAKCFVIGNRAMLGSANLTGAGLGSAAIANRELGVELTPTQAKEARAAVLAWPARDISDSELNRLLEEAQSLTRPYDRKQSSEEELDASSAVYLAEELLEDARDPRRSLWLKLEYGEPGPDSWRQDSWFASPKKGKPGFRPRDLVVMCAKATHDCYAIVEVTNVPEYQPSDYVQWTAAEDPGGLERWPWINRTTPRFVPSSLMELKLAELGVAAQALQNGHVRLKFDQFTAAVRALSRLASA